MAQQVVISFNANANFSDLIGEIRRANAEIATLKTQLNGLGPSSYNSLQTLNAQFMEGMKNSRLWTSSFVNVANETREFGRHLDQGRLKLKDYFREFNLQVRGQRGMIRRLAEEQVKLQRSILTTTVGPQGETRNILSTPTGLDRLDPATMKALRAEQFKIIGRSIQGVSTELINLGKNTQWAGRQLTVGLTIPLTIFAKTASDAFRQVDQQLIRLAKVYGDVGGATTSEIERIKGATLDLARDLAASLGAPIQETLGLAADIAATGATGEDLLKSVAETTRLAILGEVDRAEAMKATLAVQSAFKQNTDELAESINFLNAVENQTSTSLNDLVEAIPKAGPVVKGLGGDIKDLALFLVAMREGGINASESANALKSGLASIINPADKTRELLNGMGIDIEKIVVSNAGNLVDTVMDLQKALEGLDPLERSRAIEQLFGKFQFARMSALFDNLGKSGSQTLQVMELMGASTVELANIADRELSILTESASGKFARQLETLKANLALAGEGFLGIFTRVLGAINKILDSFNNLPEGVKTVITIIGALVGLAGPLIMLSGVFLNFFGYVVKGIGALGRLFTGTKKFELLDEQMMAVSLSGDKMANSLFDQALAAKAAEAEVNRLIDSMRRLVEVQNTAASGSATGMTGGLRFTARPGAKAGDIYAAGAEMSHLVSSKSLRSEVGPVSSLLYTQGTFVPGEQLPARNFQKSMQENMPGLIVDGENRADILRPYAEKFNKLTEFSMLMEQDFKALMPSIDSYAKAQSQQLAAWRTFQGLSKEQADQMRAVLFQAMESGDAESAMNQIRLSAQAQGLNFDQMAQEYEIIAREAYASGTDVESRSRNVLNKMRELELGIIQSDSAMSKWAITNSGNARKLAENLGRLTAMAATQIATTIESAQANLSSQIGALKTEVDTKTKRLGIITIKYVDGVITVLDAAGNSLAVDDVSKNPRARAAIERLRQQKLRLEQETVREVDEAVQDILAAETTLKADNGTNTATRLGLLSRVRGGVGGMLRGRGGLGSSMAMMGLGMATSMLPTGTGGNIAGGAMMGASMGMMFGPQGAAVGAALGALIPAAKALYTELDRLRDIAALTANQYRIDQEFAKAAGLNLKTLADIQLQQLTGDTEEAASQLQILSQAASEASTNLTTGALREKTREAGTFEDVRGEFESQFLAYLSSGVPEETARVMMAAILKSAGKEEFSTDLRLALNQLGATTAAEATQLALSRSSGSESLEGTRFGAIRGQAAAAGLGQNQLSGYVSSFLAAGENTNMFNYTSLSPEQISIIIRAAEAYKLLDDEQKKVALSTTSVKQQVDILGQTMANQSLEDFVNNVREAGESGDLLSGSVDGVVDSLAGLAPQERTALKQLQSNGVSSANILALLKLRVEGLNTDLSKLASYTGTRVQVYIDYIISKQKAEQARKEADAIISSINVASRSGGTGEADKKALQAKLKALQEIERKERNIAKIKELQLKHEEKLRNLSLDYLSAISAGDFQGALAAQLEMQSESQRYLEDRAETEKEIARDDEKARLQAQIDSIGSGGAAAANNLANASKKAQSEVNLMRDNLIKTFGVGGDAQKALEQFNKSPQLREFRKKLLSLGLDKEQVKTVINSMRLDMEAAINEAVNNALDLKNMPSHYLDLLRLESAMPKGNTGNKPPVTSTGTSTPKGPSVGFTGTTVVPHELGKNKWAGGQIKKYAMGGLVYGPGNSVSDSVFARLSRDEYVVRAAAVKKYGVGMMDQINDMNYRNKPEVVAGGDNVKVYVNKIEILEPGASADEIIATMEKKLFGAVNRKKDKRSLTI